MTILKRVNHLLKTLFVTGLLALTLTLIPCHKDPFDVEQPKGTGTTK